MKLQLFQSQIMMIKSLHFQSKTVKIPQSHSSQHDFMFSLKFKYNSPFQQLTSYTVSPCIISNLHLLQCFHSLLITLNKCDYVNSRGDVGYCLSEELKKQEVIFFLQNFCFFCVVNLPSQLIQWADPPWLSLPFIHNQPVISLVLSLHPHCSLWVFSPPLSPVHFLSSLLLFFSFLKSLRWEWVTRINYLTHFKGATAATVSDIIVLDCVRATMSHSIKQMNK